MLNLKRFEEKVYALVVKEVNKAFTRLLKKDEQTIRAEGIQLHRQVMKILHSITEETATQTLYGLVLRNMATAMEEKAKKN